MHSDDGAKTKNLKQAASSKKAELVVGLIAAAVCLALGGAFVPEAFSRSKSPAVAGEASCPVVKSNLAAALSALAEREATKRPTAAIELALAALAQRQANAQPDPKAEAILRRAISTNRELRRFTFPGPMFQNIPHDATFSPDGRFVLTGDNSGTGFLWDLSSGALTRTFPNQQGTLHRSTFAPDGSRVALFQYTFQTGEGRVRLVSATTGQEERNILFRREPVRGDQYVFGRVRFSPDGHYLAATANEKFARLWDAGTGDELPRLDAGDKSVFSVAFFPDGKRAATAGLTREDHVAVHVRDLASGKEIQSFDNIQSEFFQSPDGRVSYTADGGKELIFDRVSGDIQFSSDGGKLLIFDRIGNSVLLDAARGDVLANFRPPEESVAAAAYSPDLERVATSANAGVRLWDLRSGKMLATFAGHDSPPLHLAFSSDGARLLTVAVDKTVRVWDAPVEDGGGAGKGAQNLAGVVSSACEKLSDKTFKLLDSQFGVRRPPGFARRAPRRAIGRLPRVAGRSRRRDGRFSAAELQNNPELAAKSHSPLGRARARARRRHPLVAVIAQAASSLFETAKTLPPENTVDSVAFSPNGRPSPPRHGTARPACGTGRPAPRCGRCGIMTGR